MSGLPDDLLMLIDKAAPVIDQGFAGNGWRPSEAHKLAYFILATGPTGRRGAAEAIMASLLTKLREGGVEP